MQYGIEYNYHLVAINHLLWRSYVTNAKSIMPYFRDFSLINTIKLTKLKDEFIPRGLLTLDIARFLRHKVQNGVDPPSKAQ